VSGVKGENAIKLFGNDLVELTDTANKIKNVRATVLGVSSRCLRRRPSRSGVGLASRSGGHRSVQDVSCFTIGATRTP
jgi:Cu/Ag efflux pump CusA